MKNQTDTIKDILYRFTTILVIVFILISCEPFTTASPSETVLSQTSDLTQAVPRTPPALPATYQSSTLNPLDTPRTYIQNTCQYLHNKWNPLSAEPGTVVMIVMFNEIVLDDFDRIMDQLHDQGFEAIDTKQLLAFMERNVKIPLRSVLIIQNDSHPAADFTRNFREYWDRWGWIVVNGWTSDPDAPESLWQENIALEYEGWVDHQAQGVIPGTILSDDSSKAVVTRELEGSITAFTKRYAKNPIAFIWPGGGFGQRPVEAARQLGYQLGFTTNARGPVMLLDHYDNCASGGTMDTMAVLGGILDAGLENAAAFAIFDPQAVEQMKRAGVGARVTIALGGKLEMPALGLKGKPRMVTGNVRRIINGIYRNEGPMARGELADMGAAAVLDTGNVEIAVISRHVEPHDIASFRALGIDPAAKRYVMLKSRVHWRAGLGPMAKAVVECAGEGVCTSDYSQLHFRRVRRPVYPLDPETRPSV